MTEFDVALATYSLLWIIVGVIAAVLVVEARLIGSLHRRVPPSGASMLSVGPALHSQMATCQGKTSKGLPFTLGGNRGPRVYVFVTPSCPPCFELMPAVRSVHRSDRRDWPIVVVSVDGDEQKNARFVAEQRLEKLLFVLSPAAATTYSLSSTPYVVVTNQAGAVTAKGVANHMEHLESLLSDSKSTPASGQPVTKLRGAA